MEDVEEEEAQALKAPNATHTGGESLTDAVGKAANVAINMLVCPSSFFPLGALTTLI